MTHRTPFFSKLGALLLAVLLGGCPAMPAAAQATPEQAAPAQATPEQARPDVLAAQTTPEAEEPPTLRAGDILTDGVSPVGTTINLFDYWLTTRFAPDNVDPPDVGNAGINAGHVLRFGNNPGGGAINQYTGSAAPRTGMVDDTLQGGYPQLSDSGQSLDYLFNPNLANQGKIAFPSVRNLLQIDDQGYYYYNCTQNFAQYDQATNAFILYDAPGVKAAGASEDGQFFPFNDYNEVKDVNSRNPLINHYFGMTMTTRFVQQPYGTVDGTPGGTPVTYEFAGDDDVWVFIDGVLVGDLGGIHDAASLSINFQTGAVAVNGQADGTIRQKFETAGVPWTHTGSDTFADDTYHTLQFFYLERGNVDSNMKLKFNLVSIPQSDLIKVDQIGAPVPGAEFKLYYANDDYTYDPQDLIATGTTEADGTFVFQNPDGTLLSLNNLKNEYGGDGKTGKFVLVETVTPPGYRSPELVELYFPQDYPELATLLSANPWQTGAYASPTVTVTLPDAPRDLAGHTYSAEEGTYFAVVLKRQNAGGDGSSGQSQWYPVSGDPISGWKVADSTSTQAVIAAAQDDPYVFTLDSSGAYKATLQNIPGDILTYYDVLATNGKLTADNAQYTVAFYRTSAPNLAGATADNTVRLNAGTSGDQDGFDREYAVRLYVPDIKNYLFVQKVADDAVATPLTGAVFGLYTADQVENGAVKPGEQPWDTVTTRDLNQNSGDLITLGGAGVFPNTQSVLPEGTYYLKELSAPPGYALDDQLVEVVADDSNVYADAGSADNGISVLLGVGKIVRSMLQFAVPDDINATLTDIQAALYTAPNYTPGSGGSWAGWSASSQPPLQLSYNTTGQVLEYAPTQVGGRGYFTVNSGWSRLRITQNYAAGTHQDLKIDLGNQDLTNIFARSTIVRFRNVATRLVIRKQVTGELGDRQRPFAFTVTLRDSAGDPLTGNYGGVDFDADGVAGIALRDTEETVLYGLPDGTVCTVSEEPAEHYDTTVQVNGGESQAVSNVTVTTAPGLTEIIFTNACTLQPTPGPSASPTPSAKPGPAPTASPVSGDAPGITPWPPAIPETGDGFRPLGLALLCAGAAATALWLWRRRQ